MMDEWGDIFYFRDFRCHYQTFVCIYECGQKQLDFMNTLEGIIVDFVRITADMLTIT